MKKILISFLIFIFTWFSSVFAISWDDYVSNYVFLDWKDFKEFVVPAWKDFLLQSVHISIKWRWTELVTFSDSWSILLNEEYRKWEYDLFPNSIYRDSVWIETDWRNSNKIEVLYKWYLFLEWVDVVINKSDSIWTNWAKIQEYEFLRQNELFNFYQVELSFLLFLTIVIIINKFIPWSKPISFK